MMLGLSFFPRAKGVGAGSCSRVQSHQRQNCVDGKRSDIPLLESKSLVVVGGLRSGRSRRWCGGCRALDIEADVPLSAYCSFGIGGPARFLARAKSVEDFRAAARFAHEHQLQVVVVGKGSNCLFDDRGFRGLVIVNEISFVDPFPIDKPNRNRSKGIVDVEGLGDHQGLQQQQQQQQEITEDDDGKEKLILTAGSGYPFNTLGQILSSAGWSGLEFATGIPGSVGGAIFMNAGANARETVSSLVKVEYITRQGELCVVDPINASDFAYRKSPFQFMDQLLAIVSGTFELEASSNAKRRAREYMQKRNKSQPLKEKSAGCIFRNPSVSGEAAAVRPRSRPIASASASAEEELDNPTLSAGALIDRAGLKGVSCGSAQVSPVHANYLVCTGKTEQSSKDMKDLITLIKQRIKSETGISLQEEIRIIPYEVK